MRNFASKPVAGSGSAKLAVELTKHTGTEGLRSDVQALRGFAILLVLLYHAQLWPAPAAGFLGVDIFFVVSGFLITGIVRRDLLAGKFSFSEFYFRRAKRLLPAAYIVFLACALAAPLFLTQLEFLDFTKQLLGAVTFTGNIALWMQTGYFETAADLKPLLHVWSLAIEEQYYLLMPATLALTPRRWWWKMVLAVTVLSLALCLVMVSAKPGAVFYLLPTRAWELGIGSMGAFLVDWRQRSSLWRVLFWPSLVALLLVPFFPIGGSQPGLDALIICTATLVVILRSHPLADKISPVRWTARLGDISYSLYLVHWPLLAFAANAWVSPVPLHVRAGLALLSLVLAWALYRWVENPIRQVRAKPSRQRVAAIALASLSLISFGYALQRWDASRTSLDFADIRQGNRGLDDACEYGALFQNKSECHTGSAPDVLLWGDSNAMHLADAIKSDDDAGFFQATKTTCGPLMGMSVFRDSGYYNRAWAVTCLSFNFSVLEFLRAASQIDVVVLASLNGQYLRGNRLLVGSAGSPAQAVVEQEGSLETARHGYRTTIEAIRAMGRRVVIVAPPPKTGFDIGRCIERAGTGRYYFGADKEDCSFAESAFREQQSEVLSLLDAVAQENHVAVIHLEDFLCHDGRCAVSLDGVPLYADGGHLSHGGSRIIGERMHLAQRIREEAR
jgi:peptidoglycan/LPS O-acetylase OafA/YrhL